MNIVERARAYLPEIKIPTPKLSKRPLLLTLALATASLPTASGPVSSQELRQGTHEECLGLGGVSAAFLGGDFYDLVELAPINPSFTKELTPDGIHISRIEYTSKSTSTTNLIVEPQNPESGLVHSTHTLEPGGTASLEIFINSAAGPGPHSAEDKLIVSNDEIACDKPHAVNTTLTLIPYNP